MRIGTKTQTHARRSNPIRPKRQHVIKPASVHQKKINGWPRMRDLVLLGSSIVLPPDPIPPHHRTKPKPKPKPKPSLLTSTSARLSPPISSLRSRHPLLSDVRWDLNNYSDLATKLVQDGRFDDFSTMVETLILSGVELSQLVELVSAGISGLLREGRVYCVVEVLRKVDKLGICPLELFDGSTLELLSKECRRILNCGQVEEVVELIEILDGEFLDFFALFYF